MAGPWEKYGQAKAKPWEKYGASNIAPEMQPSTQPLNWSDIPGQMVQNAPASAGQFASDFAQPFLHPKQTVETLADAAAGGLREGARAVLPASVFNFIEGIDPDPQAAERASQTVGAVGGFLKDRYGGMENIKRTLATDPVGSLGDLSMLIGGGAGIAGSRIALASSSKAAGVAAKLKTAAKVTNPINIAGAPIPMLARGAAHVIAPMSGVAPQALQEAARAGREGGGAGKAFRANLFGQEPQGAVVGDLKGALDNISKERSAQYLKDMQSVKGSTTKINTAPIEKAMTDMVDSLYEPGSGLRKAGGKTFNTARKIGAVVDEWLNNQAGTTPIGLDALKQRIDDLMPSIPKKNQARVITEIRNAVKDSIVKQVPEYAKAMENFSTSISASDETTKALALGTRASKDTALRHLQMVMRNNTNSRSRTEHIKALEKHGAPNAMAKLAGQSLGTLMPRGLAQLHSPAALIAALYNPSLFPLLGLTSPGIMGGLSHLGGIGAKYGSKAAGPLLAALQAGRMNNQNTKGPR